VRPLILFAAVVALVGCSASLPDYDYSTEPDPRGKPFVIGVSDVVRVSVWKNPGLTASSPVSPDGTITMPLIGEITASGRTSEQLKAEIQRKLNAYLKDAAAVVTVTLAEVNSYRFSVSGEVANPGVFSSKEYVTLVEALALAGGPTRFANTNGVTIVRRNKNGTLRSIPVSYEAIIKQRREDMNLVILAGDRVQVP
jgi:polysaccharide export outer membrane protein